MGYDKFEKQDAFSPVFRPFPGAYPTRIRILTGKAGICYQGKPVPGLLSWFVTHHLRKGADLRFVTITEFDQNGVIRRVVGASEAHTPFANAVFPMPEWWDFISRRARVLVMLDRERVEVDGKILYANPFFKGTKWEDTAKRMLKEAAALKIAGRRWFSIEAVLEMCGKLDTECEKWYPVKKKAEEPANPIEAGNPFIIDPVRGLIAREPDNPEEALARRVRRATGIPDARLAGAEEQRPTTATGLNTQITWTLAGMQNALNWGNAPDWGRM